MFAFSKEIDLFVLFYKKRTVLFCLLTNKITCISRLYWLYYSLKGFVPKWGTEGKLFTTLLFFWYLKNVEILDKWCKMYICKLHFLQVQYQRKNATWKTLTFIFYALKMVFNRSKCYTWCIICQTNQFYALPLRFLLNSKFWSIGLF